MVVMAFPTAKSYGIERFFAKSTSVQATT